MIEYISKWKVIEALHELKQKSPTYFELPLETAIERIRGIPATDVRPVVQGEWWPIFEADENGEPYEAGLCCSECHAVLQYEPYFCPDCGAEMRGAKR